MRFSVLLIAGLLLWPSFSFADVNDACVKMYVPHAAEVGHGRMTFLAWKLYDATLYAPGGNYDENKPFALVLSYLHAFKGDDIANQSISEMKRLGLSDVSKIDKWRAEMKDIFPDVSAGDEITGVYIPGGATIFCQGQDALGVIKDPMFGRNFFGIWLDEKSKSATLRQSILGEDNEKDTASGDGHGS
jgi:hypothetical protein